MKKETDENKKIQDQEILIWQHNFFAYVLSTMTLVSDVRLLLKSREPQSHDMETIPRFRQTIECTAGTAVPGIQCTPRRIPQRAHHMTGIIVCIAV